MNAFLAGLVDRAQGRAPVLERRPRALFEPQRPEPAARIEEIAQDTSADEPRVAAAASHAAHPSLERPIDRPLLPAVAPLARPVGREPAPARHESMPARPALLAVEPLPASRRGSASTDDDAPRSPRRSSTPEARDTSREPAPRRAETANAALPTAPVRPRSAEATAREPRPREASTPASPAVTTVQHVHHHHAASPAAARATTPVVCPAVLLAKAAQSPPPRREPAAAPASPPPVQITIGRVEVRAVHAPAERARSAAPAAPRLSLDDYLRRRSGGSR